MTSWLHARLVWLAQKHLGLGNEETWGRIITNSAYCDENYNDGNNNNNGDGFSRSCVHHFCGCVATFKMVHTDNVAFYISKKKKNK